MANSCAVVPMADNFLTSNYPQAFAPLSVRAQKPQSAVSELPDHFYNLPDASKCHFSIYGGTRARRSLPHPSPLPILRTNLVNDIKCKAEELRRKFPEIVRSIESPTKWSDLYNYFDAYDIWVLGASFCYYVIADIATENSARKELYDKEISKYAAEWVASHWDIVLANPPQVDLINLFTGEEAEGLKIMTAQEQETLGKELAHQRMLFLTSQSFHPRPVQPLFPLQEGFPPMTSPFITPTPSMVPLKPIIPPPSSHQNYHEFMQNHRSIPPNVHKTPQQFQWNAQDQNRRRGLSNEANGNGFGTLKNSFRQQNFQNTRRTVSNTHGHSSPHHANGGGPIYVRTGQSPTSHRIASEPINSQFPRYSNDARVHDQFPYNGGQMTNQSVGSFADIFKREGRDTNKFYITKNESCTWYYDGIRRPYNRDENLSSTLCISNVNREYFLNHTLYRLLRVCGEIDYIHFHDRLNSYVGLAYVMFMQDSSIGMAIKEFNGHKMPSGKILDVKLADKRDTGSRARSNSQYSQYSQRSYGQGRPSDRGDELSGNRRYSNKNSSISNIQFTRPDLAGSNYSHEKSNTPPRPPVGMGPQLQLAMSEIGTHQTTLNRLPSQMALGSIQNILKYHKKSDIQEKQFKQLAQQPGLNKENSPMGELSLNKLPKMDKQVGGGNSSAGRGGKKKKGSKQSTSIKPTPATTPVKLRSTTRFIDMRGSHDIKNSEDIINSAANKLDSAQGSSQKSQALIDGTSLDHFSPRQKQWRSKNSKVQASGRSENPTLLTSFTAEPALEMTSPTGTVDSLAESFSANSTTSASHCSSEPKQSVVSAKSESRSDSQINQSGKQAPPQSKFISKGRKHEQKDSQQKTLTNDQNHKQQVDTTKVDQIYNTIAQPATSGSSTTSTAPKNVPEKTTPAKLNEKIKEIQHNEQNPAKSPTDQTRLLKENVSSETLASKNEPKSVPPINEQKVSPPKEIDSASKVGNVKQHKQRDTDSISSVSSTSVRKSDAKSAKSSRKTSEGASVSTPRQPGSPKSPTFDDPAQWPALGPSSSPQSIIADGKRPPPIAAPPLVRTPVPRKTPGSVVPAVPVIKKPRPQSFDPVGGLEWPFLKKCKPK